MDLLKGKRVRNKLGEEILSDNALVRKGILIFFFASSWCPASKQLASKIKDFYHRAQHEGVEACLVSMDLEASKMYEFMRESDLPFLALEPQSEVALSVIARFDVHKVPTVVATDSEGRVLSRDDGSDVEGCCARAMETWRKLTK